MAHAAGRGLVIQTLISRGELLAILDRSFKTISLCNPVGTNTGTNMLGDGKPKPTLASSKWLPFLGLAIASGFAAVCGVVLLEMRDRDYEHARQASANLVASVASDIDRNIELYDL